MTPVRLRRLSDLRPWGAACLGAALLSGLFSACGTSATSEDGTSRPPTTASTSAPSDSSPPPAPAPTRASSTEQVVVDVTIDRDKVSPFATRVRAKVGRPVLFRVTSDRAGGLHVHSSPEQSPEFAAGKTTLRVTIDKPGIVEIEEHESDKVLVLLEVR